MLWESCQKFNFTRFCFYKCSTNIASLRAIFVLRFEQSIIHTKSKFKKMEVIQLYLALNCLSFLIPSITGAGKAAIIICMSLTKETILSESFLIETMIYVTKHDELDGNLRNLVGICHSQVVSD